ncbi:MAG: hypothetical protein SGPRY_004076 [Prymnesium sp.]
MERRHARRRSPPTLHEPGDDSDDNNTDRARPALTERSPLKPPGERGGSVELSGRERRRRGGGVGTQASREVSEETEGWAPSGVGPSRRQRRGATRLEESERDDAAVDVRRRGRRDGRAEEMGVGEEGGGGEGETGEAAAGRTDRASEQGSENDAGSEGRGELGSEGEGGGGSPRAQRKWGIRPLNPGFLSKFRRQQPEVGSPAPAPAQAEDPPRLGAGLTQRAPLRVRSAAVQGRAEASLYVAPRLPLPWLFHTLGTEPEGARFTRPIVELHDGLFVEQMPEITPRSVGLLDARLGPAFEPPSKATRTEIGSVLRQPDPVLHVRLRPALSRQQRDPRTMAARGQASTRLVGAGERPRASQHAMQVSLGLLQLYDHPLFTQEHRLQTSLRSLAEQFAEQSEMEKIPQYERKITELALTVRHLKEQLGSEECTERLLARRMLLAWNDLKRLRASQRFKATRAQLQMQPIESDAGEDRREMERDLIDEMEERRLVARLQGRSPPDERRLREEIETRQRELRRPPGETQYFPVYTEQGEVTPFASLEQAEFQRQLGVTRESVYAVLLVDGRIVSSTTTFNLNPFDFCVQLGTSLEMQLLQAPSSMALQLWQKRLVGLADRLLAEIFLAVPDSASPVEPQWQHYSFSAERPFKREGVREAEDGEVIPAPHRYLCGQVSVSVAWITLPARRQSGGTAVRRAGAEVASGALDTHRVRQLVEVDNLDPNAPQDVPLLSLLSRAEGGREGKSFRMLWLRRELQWVKGWLESERLKLLEIRRKRPHEWVALPESERAVPSRDGEISKRQRELLQPSLVGKGDEEPSRDGSQQLSKLRQWVRDVTARQRAASAARTSQASTGELVREPLLEIEWATCSCAQLLKLFAPRRQLLPHRRARKPAPGSNEVARQVEVVVKGGVDLPVRAVGERSSRPLVEISFQGQKKRTTVKEGANPIWNQLVHLNMTVPHGDWSQQALASLPDEICFNVLDAVKRARHDDRDAHVTTVSEEPRWLGGFSLPFSTLYRNGKVEGTFPLTMPPVLLGYKKDVNSKSTKLAPASGLKLFITLEPLLPPMRDAERERTTSRDLKMQQFAKGWVQSIRNGLPKELRTRRILAFAPDDTGACTLVCRYVRPLSPPDDMRHESTLLRFVSLIPRMDDAALGMRIDVWNTCSSFLDLNAGDEEEHALLLCNFFLELGKEAYVLLGHGIPEGETAYVLTRESSSPRLWNAQAGKVYRADDAACPLTSVGCIFNNKNIWANIQPSDKSSELSWDLEDPKCWRPFFGPRGFETPAGLRSVQPDRLVIRKTPKDRSKSLESDLEYDLQREFEKLRGHRVTNWSHSAAKPLKELLELYEKDARGVQKLSEGEHEAAMGKLNKASKTYRLVGFPINQTYTDVHSLKEKLRNTNMHLSDCTNMDFALVVYVHAYPNDVLSVWFYIASLEDTRSGDRSITY